MVGRSAQGEDDFVANERTRPRRFDRAMPSDAHVQLFLERAPFGFLATSVEDQPYVIPKLFWYDKTTRRIYFHSATEGRTRESILRNPKVCFSAAELGRILPADEACEFGVEYASVCVFGHARLVRNDEEKLHGLQGLMKKLMPEMREGEHYQGMDPKTLKRTSVYAVEIEAWSGKQRDVEA